MGLALEIQESELRKTMCFPIRFFIFQDNFMITWNSTLIFNKNPTLSSLVFDDYQKNITSRLQMLLANNNFLYNDQIFFSNRLISAITKYKTLHK